MKRISQIALASFQQFNERRRTVQSEGATVQLCGLEFEWRDNRRMAERKFPHLPVEEAAPIADRTHEPQAPARFDVLLTSSGGDPQAVIAAVGAAGEDRRDRGGHRRSAAVRSPRLA
jgi:hypothetical protein